MLKESQIEQNRAKAGNSIVLVDKTKLQMQFVKLQMSENGTKYSKIKISVDGERQKSNPHSILFHGPFSMLS